VKTTQLMGRPGRVDHAFSTRANEVGRIEVPGPQVFWMSEWDRWLTLVFHALLVEDDGIKALIDTGPPDDIAPLNSHVRTMLGSRGTFCPPEVGSVADQPRALGVSPDTITHVTLTPKVLHYLMIDAWDRVRLLEDEDQIAPGLQTSWAGTHHRATIVIEIDTDEGVAIASDACFYLESITENRLLGINESMAQGHACYECVRATAAHIPPLADPRLPELSPGSPHEAHVRDER